MSELSTDALITMASVSLSWALITPNAPSRVVSLPSVTLSRLVESLPVMFASMALSWIDSGMPTIAVVSTPSTIAWEPIRDVVTPAVNESRSSLICMEPTISVPLAVRNLFEPWPTAALPSSVLVSSTLTSPVMVFSAMLPEVDASITFRSRVCELPAPRS